MAGEPSVIDLGERAVHQILIILCSGKAAQLWVSNP